MEEKKPIYIDRSYDYRTDVGYVPFDDDEGGYNPLGMILRSIRKTTQKNTKKIDKNTEYDKQQQEEIEVNRTINEIQFAYIEELSAKTLDNSDTIDLLADDLVNLTIVTDNNFKKVDVQISGLTDDINIINSDIDNIASELNQTHIERDNNIYTLFVGADERGVIEMPVLSGLTNELENEIAEREKLSEIVSSNTNYIQDEISRAISAETQLDEKIDELSANTTNTFDLVNDNLVKLENEISGLTNALRDTDDVLAEEINTRKDNVETLFNSISVLNDIVIEEISARTSDVKEINNNIDILSSYTKNNINELINKDNLLDEQITNEITRATVAESGLTDLILSAKTILEDEIRIAKDEAISAATYNDTEIKQLISDEVLRAITAEEVVNGKINDENLRATNEEKLLSNSLETISGKIDTHIEKYNLFKSETEQSIGDNASEIRKLVKTTNDISYSIENNERDIAKNKTDIRDLKNDKLNISDFTSYTSKTKIELDVIKEESSKYLTEKDIKDFITKTEVSTLSGMIKSDIASVSGSLQSQISQLDNDLHLTNVTVSKLNDTVNDLTTEVSTYSSDIEDLKEITAKFEPLLKVVDDLQDACNALQAEIDSLKTRVKVLEEHQGL